MMTAPNSPRVRAIVRTMPYVSPHRIDGSVMRQNVCHHCDPSVEAASYWSLPISCNTGST